MRSLVLAASAVAAFLAAQSLAHRADAAPLGNPAALAGAVEDTSLVEAVHCRRGWRHHQPTRWRRTDGCQRGSAVMVVPGRSRYVIRDGVRVRVGAGGTSTRATIRSKTTTTVRTTRGNRSTGGASVNVQSGQKGMTSGRGKGEGGKAKSAPTEKGSAGSGEQKSQ